MFITGTTGFLGAFLLDELLRTTGRNTRLYCLVRDRKDGRGASANRVLETLKRYGLQANPHETGSFPSWGTSRFPGWDSTTTASGSWRRPST